LGIETQVLPVGKAGQGRKKRSSKKPPCNLKRREMNAVKRTVTVKTAWTKREAKSEKGGNSSSESIGSCPSESQAITGS